MWAPLKNSAYRKLLKYAKAQARVETANFSSTLFKDHNNAFGMNCVRVRDTTQITCTDPVFDRGMSKGVYAIPADSVQDFVMWLVYTNFPFSVRNVDQYVQELDKRKFFGTSYGNYLQAMKSQLK